MNNSLNQKFNVTKLLKFALPTTLMMVFMAIYTMVDGFFVSNFVSENAFSAINIVFPAIAFVIAIGTMISTGGSAVVSKKLGDLVNVFRDDDLRREMNQDQVIYRVQAYLPVDEGTEAGLFFYTSIIYQGKVGD